MKRESSPQSIPKRMNRVNEARAASQAIIRTTTSGNNVVMSNPEQNEDVASLKMKINLLEKDLERRQESYIARERAYKTRIDELEDDINQQRQNKIGWMKTDSKMKKLKSMQSQILSNVELVQDRTARILQEQERDLLRAFRARLFDVQTELEKEKSKKDDGAGAWIERSHQLEAEVDWAKEVADRLERANQTLTQENLRLKAQFQSQEEDRNFLIKQLVAVKKENANFRNEYAALEQKYDELQQMKTNEANNNAPRVVDKKSDSEDRYKEVNKRLKQNLLDEKRRLEQTRQNYTQELKARTEMELLLRQCVDDVRREITRKQLESADDAAYGTGAGTDTFTKDDRERVLELLLSQERVVSLLYAKTFPVSVKSTGLSLEDIGPGGDIGSSQLLPAIQQTTKPFSGDDSPL